MTLLLFVIAFFYLLVIATGFSVAIYIYRDIKKHYRAMDKKLKILNHGL